MRDNMHVRIVEEDDLDACAAVHMKTFSQPPWNEHWTLPSARVRIRDMHAMAGSLGLCATVNDEVVAYAMGYAETALDGRHFRLKEMCVLPSLQRQGIGSCLLGELNRELATRGVTRIGLMTSRGSAAARFYAKNGFGVIGGKVMMGRRVAAAKGE